MSADDEADPPGTAQRARDFVARARRTPEAIDEVAAEVASTQAQLAEVKTALARLEDLAWAGRDDTRGGVAAVGDELGVVHIRIQDLAERLERVDGAVAGQATAVHRAIAAPARRQAAADLRSALGPAPDLTPGLSIFTLCWNHGGLLEESVRSGLAALDALAPEAQGELLILDDASSDHTPAVAAALAEEDPRVRVIRSEVNLGLALARSTLLHAATTSHAFQLDADNTATATGVAALLHAAEATGAALTYGTIVQVDGRGVAMGPISNEPPAPALFQANYIDTMAVTDVAAFRALGGWSPDPLLEHVDDWAAVHRVIEAGLLITFVPTLVGRYRVLDTAFHHSVGDPRIGAARVARVFDPTGRRQGPDAMDGVVAIAYDAETGPLWATLAARAGRPDLAPVAPPTPVPAPTTTRVLVVAPGGVANVGDDAITVRGLERLRATLGPEVDVDLLTDGPAPTAGLGPVRWLGPLTEVLAGLDYDQLGRLDAPLAAAAAHRQVGQGRWHALDPAAYDACLVLGGGSLVSEWAEGLVAPRALLAAALRQARVPYALSGQGIGPLDHATDRQLVAGLLAGAAAVSCRDHESGALARSLPGVDPTHVLVTGDDALGLAPSGEPGGSSGLVVTVRSAPYVGGDDHLAAVQRWMQAADALAVARGWDVVGLALNGQAPAPEIATLAEVRATTPLVARWRLEDTSTDPRRLVAVVAGAQAVAAQSFHAALLALDSGVPAVLSAATPYYVAKAAGLAAHGDLPDALGVTGPDRLADALDQVTRSLRDTPRPLAARRAEVDAWWTALPSTLGLAVRGGAGADRRA